MSVKDWSTTAANNNAAVPEGAPEGWLFSDVNNVVRQIMKHIRDWYNDAAWIEYGDGDGAYTATWVSATQLRIAGSDQTSQYHPFRQIRITGSISGVTVSSIVTSLFTAGNTNITIRDSMNATNEVLTKVELLAVPAIDSGVAMLAANNYFFGDNNTFSGQTLFNNDIWSTDKVALASDTAPYGWGSGMPSVDFGANGVGAVMSNNWQTYLTHNCYHDGTNWRYKKNGSAHYLLMSNIDPIGALVYSESGTADAVVSFPYQLNVNLSGTPSFNTTGLAILESGARVVSANSPADANAISSNAIVESKIKRTTVVITSLYAGTAQYAVNHGLGGRPDFVQWYWRCTVSDLGYSVSDRVPLSTDDSFGAAAISAWVSDTQLGVLVNSDPRILRKSDSSTVSPTAGRWVIEAVCINIS